MFLSTPFTESIGLPYSSVRQHMGIRRWPNSVLFLGNDAPSPIYIAADSYLVSKEFSSYHHTYRPLLTTLFSYRNYLYQCLNLRYRI